MTKYSIFLLLVTALMFNCKDTYSQWYRSDDGKAYVFFKGGVYPFEESWEYVTPFYFQGIIEWDVTTGTYLQNNFIEAGLELSRPYWAVQINFGIKEEEIHIKNTNVNTKFGSNYCTLSVLFFPLKQIKTINPFVFARAGINFRSEHIEDNADMFSIGGGIRAFLSERFGVELIFESQSIDYKRIPIGQDLLGRFIVRPVRISLGIIYEI